MKKELVAQLLFFSLLCTFNPVIFAAPGDQVIFAGEEVSAFSGGGA